MGVSVSVSELLLNLQKGCPTPVVVVAGYSPFEKKHYYRVVDHPAVRIVTSEAAIKIISLYDLKKCTKTRVWHLAWKKITLLGLVPNK